MFVPAGHRGRGFARAVLAELERIAAAAGRRRTVLETGTRQPEAIALYTSAGYTPVEPVRRLPRRTGLPLLRQAPLVNRPHRPLLPHVFRNTLP